jgi:phosphopantetheine--protein transferase-like protein
MNSENFKTVAVGIDAVIISRFESWRFFSNKQLSKIFSLKEIEYAHSNRLFFAQRLAVRFAAKEAFLKAFQQIYPEKKIGLLIIAKAVSIGKNQSGMPFFIIDWKKISPDKKFQTTLSITHEQCHATAIVIIYN